MSFKKFFIKQIMMPFFVITTCVSIGAGVLGVIFASEQRLSYYALFMPAFYGVATSLPSIVTYSRRELSPREVLVRKILQLVMIEGFVLGINWWGGNLTSVSITASLFLTVLIICFTALAVEYINDKRTADELNEALKKLKEKK